MGKHAWQLQEAKSRFSQLVEEAQRDGPQIVTKHGSNAVVVLDYGDYCNLTKKDQSLVAFLQNSPLAGMELDLERNKDLPRDSGL